MLLTSPDAPPFPDSDERWPDELPASLVGFTDYLDRCRPEQGAIPQLDRFDLLGLPDLIAQLVLIDPIRVDKGAPRFRFRFVGTWHLLTFGYDVTGRHVDELHDDPLNRQSQKSLHRVVETGEAHYWRRPSVFHQQEHLHYQRIMAPLADRDGRVVRLVGCYDRA